MLFNNTSWYLLELIQQNCAPIASKIALPAHPLVTGILGYAFIVKRALMLALGRLIARSDLDQDVDPLDRPIHT